MNNMESIPLLIGKLTWKHLNGKANTAEKRLLKAFTAYYKTKKIDDQIRGLIAKSKPYQDPLWQEPQQYYKIPRLTSTAKKFKKWTPLPIGTVSAFTDGIVPTPATPLQGEPVTLTAEKVNDAFKKLKKHSNGKPKTAVHGRKFI